MSGTARPNVATFSVHVTYACYLPQTPYWDYGRDSVYLWRRHVLPVNGRRHVEEHATQKRRILKPELETASKYDTNHKVVGVTSSEGFLVSNARDNGTDIC